MSDFFQAFKNKTFKDMILEKIKKAILHPVLC